MANDDTITLASTPTGSSPQTRGDLVIPRRLGPVTLVRELGRGGMGSVWLGRDDMLGRDVAVKFLLNAVTDPDDPGFARFLDGARAAAAVRHSCLTAMFAAELVNGVPYLVMEYVNGPTVAAVIEQLGAMELPAAHAIMDAVADAIGELHERDIVHRDIKPANVLLDAEGRVFVTDFGLAFRRTSRGKEAQVAGTPAYMAPEMFESTVSQKSDVYAMGVMLFEMLTGRRPFEPSGTAGSPRPPRGPLPIEQLRERHVPDAVIDVVERAVNVNPMFRHKSAATFRQALREAVGASHDAQRGSRTVASLVARLTGDSGASTSPATNVGTPNTTYFDELSTIAARRRLQVAEAHGTPSPAQSAVTLHAEPSLGDATPVNYPTLGAPVAPGECLPNTKTIPCIKCGYDLRGMDLQNKCPECGSAVIDSTRSDRLVFASPIWLKRVAKGLQILRYCFATVIGLYFIPFVGLFVGIYPSDRVMMWLGLPIMACMTIGPIVGVWMATSDEPDRLIEPRQSQFALMARAGTLVWLALFALWYFSLRSGGLSVATSIALSIPMGLGLLGGMSGFGLILSRMLDRIPEARLARLLRIDSIVFAVLLSAAPAMFFFKKPIIILPLILAAIWYWFRLGACQRALRRVLQVSS